MYQSILEKLKMKKGQMNKMAITFIGLSLLFTGFVGLASAQKSTSDRVGLFGFDSFATAKRTVGAGQVTEIINRKISKIYGVVPAIIGRIAEIPQVEIPTVEIPTVEIPAIEKPTVEIPVVEIPTVKIPTIEIPQVEIPVF
jgi:hypothetical protein